MANRNPTKEEKQLLQDMRSIINDEGLGILYPGYDGRTDYHIHHVQGKAAKHNKVHIGYNFILPVPIELHDNGNHPLNVTHHKRAFTGEYGRQCDIYISIINIMGLNGYIIPGQHILDAIVDTGA